MRTGIFGGSFNPMHIGHIELGGWLLEQGFLDELWFLVSPQNPMKQEDDLLDDDLRLRMARISVESYQRDRHARIQFRKRSVRVLNIEAGLPRPSYMVNTLSMLKQHFPKRKFVLIIGADNWLKFPHWHRADEILEYYSIIIYPRPGFELDPSQLPGNVTYATGAPQNGISSTEIRRQIATNPAYSGEGLMPEAWEYIRRYELYSVGN